eukprot:CAMPEP_0202030120 /NCGR_PEP_ID=MMETSP0905-20130828/64334_1 /ASSEMBLY_ACC=CAM_ASM_000554 /TAXON_ID=420261 /ORGANISM="Thalassiosira antarctica, Strain CCMP982" /LENGTH=76 /DNA_ID=CAMNT_0048593909 /DNA_START=445 /DNA_END=675 /DNA_ORIENTATION=-
MNRSSAVKVPLAQNDDDYSYRTVPPVLSLSAVTLSLTKTLADATRNIYLPQLVITNNPTSTYTYNITIENQCTNQK